MNSSRFILVLVCVLVVLVHTSLSSDNAATSCCSCGEYSDQQDKCLGLKSERGTNCCKYEDGACITDSSLGIGCQHQYADPVWIIRAGQNSSPFGGPMESETAVKATESPRTSDVDHVDGVDVVDDVDDVLKKKLNELAGGEGGVEDIALDHDVSPIPDKTSQVHPDGTFADHGEFETGSSPHMGVSAYSSVSSETADPFDAWDAHKDSPGGSPKPSSEPVRELPASSFGGDTSSGSDSLDGGSSLGASTVSDDADSLPVTDADSLPVTDADSLPDGTGNTMVTTKTDASRDGKVVTTTKTVTKKIYDAPAIRDGASGSVLRGSEHSHTAVRRGIPHGIEVTHRVVHAPVELDESNAKQNGNEKAIRVKSFVGAALGGEFLFEGKVVSTDQVFKGANEHVGLIWIQEGCSSCPAFVKLMLSAKERMDITFVIIEAASTPEICEKDMVAYDAPGLCPSRGHLARLARKFGGSGVVPSIVFLNSKTAAVVGTVSGSDLSPSMSPDAVARVFENVLKQKIQE